ncbi:MAG TPA: response regulator [Lacipirellulaceae bacterium]|nr:response regulator [Lacipirellulaceae bacterium]
MTTKAVLLVDDDDDFLRLLGDHCARIGLDVKCAHNLLNATMRVAEQPPDIICVDVELPTGNGLDFCKELTANASTANIPVVVITGQSGARIRKACERLNAYYVEKTGDFWTSLEPILRELAATPNSRAAQPRPAALAARPMSNNQQFSSTEPTPNATSTVSKKVVIADDDADLLQLLSSRFTALGCSVIGVDNALDAINIIHRAAPDLVCLDVSMPSGNGLSICEMMAADERLRKVPVIVLTGRSDEAIIRRCHDLLVYYVQKSVDTWARLAPLACELLCLHQSVAPVEDKSLAQNPPTLGEGRVRVPCLSANSTIASVALAKTAAPSNREPYDLVDAVFAVLGAARDSSVAESESGKPAGEFADQNDVPWVLCIDDDPDFSDALRIRLEEHGVAVVRAFTGLDGYRLAFTSAASAILLDFHMPNGQGDYILGRLKDNPVTRDIPVFVITGNRDKVLERRMLAMGAAAFFEKPIDFNRLRKRLANYINILESPEEPGKTPPAAFAAS